MNVEYRLTKAHLAIPVVAIIAAGVVLPIALLLVISVFSVNFSEYELEPNFTFSAWREVLTHLSYWTLIGRSLVHGAVAALMTGLVGYPVAISLAKLPNSTKATALAVLLTPLYSGEIVRVYAWRLVLGQNGLVNATLQGLHVISEPLNFLLFTPIATHTALFYDNLPFMVLSLWIAIERIDPRLLEAARDLGCRPLTAFRLVILPLTGVGLSAGCFIVFSLAAGAVLAPNLLGGTSGATPMTMIDNLFGTAFDWPTASVLALTLLAVLFLSAGLLAASVLVISGAATPARRGLS